MPGVSGREAAVSQTNGYGQATPKAQFKRLLPADRNKVSAGFFS